MEYICKVFFSSELNKKEISDFIFVQQNVFPNSPMSYEDFKIKFLDNVYGDSIIVIIYDSEGNPAAARALWRNDLDGSLAYQPTDTAVCKEHRRQGLFVTMTKAALEKATAKALIYNFPNGNSFPQYLKLGWGIYKLQYTRFFTPKNYIKEDNSIIESKYFSWWMLPKFNDQYRYAKFGNKYFLVKTLGRCRNMVLGRLNLEDAKKLKPAKFGIFTYQSAEKSFYNDEEKTANVIVSLNVTEKNSIPNWKTDVI